MVYKTEERSYFANILFRYPAQLSRFLCLSYFPTAVCVFAPNYLLRLYSAASARGVSHLLDLIEFFPEEEMFPPNESVEILHSDKHDPIFRLIKESLSLPCLRRQFLVSVDRSLLPAVTPRFSSHDFRLCPKRFPIKRTRYSRAYRRKKPSI